MSRILLIEDDLPLAETTQQYLENFGFSVTHAADGLEGVDVALQGSFDLLLLDLMLPGIDGLEICRRLRAAPETAQLPILMITARGDETDRVVGLEIGADDYLTKPYSLREMVARIRANLRRVGPGGTPSPATSPAAPAGGDVGTTGSAESADDAEVLCEGSLVLDRRLRTVMLRGEEIELTATEFELLWVFVGHPQQVMTREQLLDQVRGREFDAFDRSIDVHMSKLRKKLELNPKQPKILQTVWGVGYRFVPPGEA